MAGISRSHLYGGVIGAFAAAALLLVGPHILPPSVFSLLEYFVLTPAKVLMLPVILASNYWPTFSFITAMSVIAWAIVGALISIIYRRRRAHYPTIQHEMRITPGSIIVSLGSVSITVLAIWIPFALLSLLGMLIGRPALSSLASPDLYQVQTMASIEFPKSARLLYSYQVTWQGTEMGAKVEINRDDVEKFLRGFPGVSSTDRAGFKNWKEVSWWDPDSSHKFKAAKCPLDHGEISIFAGLDSGKRVPVYIHYWD